MENKIEKNEIIITLDIPEKDFNKKDNCYFLDNTNYIEFDNHQNKHIHNFLNELNSTNVNLYVNNKYYKYFNKYFNPGKPGIYKIKLEFKIKMTNCSHMFDDCRTITEIDLSNFDTSEVNDMSYMFFYCTKLKKLNLSNINTKKVKNMYSMFYYCLNLIELDLSSFDTSQVNNMSCMFTKCVNLNYLNLSKFNTQNVIDMTKMFSGCVNLRGFDLHSASFNTKSVKTMKKMFKNCKNLDLYNLKSFNIDSVEDISYMLYNCKSITFCKLCSNHSINNKIKMDKIFNGCNNLVYVDLSSFNTKNSDIFNVFRYFRSYFGDCYNYINYIIK